MASSISFAAGSFLLIVCIIVMWEYWPRFKRAYTATDMLMLGIFLGFLGSALNTFWWQVLGVMNDSFGWVSGEQFQEIGRYLDGIFKGLPAVAGMIHLKAKRRMEQEIASRGG